MKGRALTENVRLTSYISASRSVGSASGLELAMTIHRNLCCPTLRASDVW
jgi:hypothetical protein